MLESPGEQEDLLAEGDDLLIAAADDLDCEYPLGPDLEAGPDHRLDAFAQLALHLEVCLELAVIDGLGRPLAGLARAASLHWLFEYL